MRFAAAHFGQRNAGLPLNAFMRTVLRFLASRQVARNALHRILPMDQTVLQPLVWECTAVGGIQDVTWSLINGIISRHHDARLRLLLAGPMEYTRFSKCISRLLGTQLCHKYPVTRGMWSASCASIPPC